MRKLLVRLSRLLAIRGVFLLVVMTGALLGGLVFGTVDLGEVLRPELTLVLAGYFYAVRAVFSASAAYRRTARSRTHEEIVPLLEPRTYCLLLRSFGDDGRVLLPEERSASAVTVPLENWLDPCTTFEQVLAATATGCKLDCVGVVDQRSFLVAPGVTFVGVPHETWRDVVRDLIVGAHTIVLLVGAGKEMREGFRWEVETIVAEGAAERTAIFMPPPHGPRRAYARSRRQVCDLLHTLHHRVVEPDVFATLMPPTAFGVQVVAGALPRWWRSEWGRPYRLGGAYSKRAGDDTYADALTQAMVGNEEWFSEERYDYMPARDTTLSQAVRVSGVGAATAGVSYRFRGRIKNGMTTVAEWMSRRGW